MNVLYTAEALATGDGRDGHTRTADGKIDVYLSLLKELGGSGGGFQLAVTVEVSVPHLPRPEAQILVDKAHQVCPSLNAVHGDVDVDVVVGD